MCRHVYIHLHTTNTHIYIHIHTHTYTPPYTHVHIHTPELAHIGTTWAPLEAELSQHKLILYKDSVEKPCDSFSVRSLATVFRDEKEPCIFTIIKDPSIGGGTITLRAIDPPLTKKWVGLLRDAIQAARMDAESKVGIYIYA